MKDLSPGEVHLWQAWLDLSPDKIRLLEGLLSNDELERARRFHFQRHRQQFVARRGMLRMIIGAYLSAEPESLRFSYSEFGKPDLALPLQSDGLLFNLSSSGGLALYAFAQRRQVGVDVEKVRQDFEHERIGRFFSLREQSALLSLPAEQRAQAFFNCWTRKEAFIKAHGEGLSLPLDQFDVSIASGDEARLLATRFDPGEAERWTLQHLSPAPGYVGALAVEGSGWQLECAQVESLWEPNSQPG